jgi:hypothetical protein
MTRLQPLVQPLANSLQPHASSRPVQPLNFGVIADGQPPMVLDTGAQLAGISPRYTFLDGPRLAWNSFKAALSGQSLSDHSLANLDDQVKKAGGLGIAALATAGALKGIMGVGEFIGFATWFGAMAVTPFVINAFTRLFSGGVNLGQDYINSQGERKAFFLDPQYIPLSLLRESQMVKLADRFGISNQDPDRQNKIERQLQKMSVQSRAWWMLVAGPATPIISGLLTDRLQEPVANGIHRMQRGWAIQGLSRAQNEPAATSALKSLVTHSVGDQPHAALSQWWKQLSNDILVSTHLPQAFDAKDWMNIPGQEALTDKIAEHLSRSGHQSNPAAVGDRLAKAIAQREKQLAALETQLLETLDSKAVTGLKAAASQQSLAEIKQLVALRLADARGALGQYERLAELLKTPKVEASAIRQLLEKGNLSFIQQLVSDGQLSTAEKLVGRSKLGELTHLINHRFFGVAYNNLGATPMNHLRTQLEENLLRGLWRRWINLAGGVLLGATALFALVSSRPIRWQAPKPPITLPPSQPNPLPVAVQNLEASA